MDTHGYPLMDQPQSRLALHYLSAEASSPEDEPVFGLLYFDRAVLCRIARLGPSESHIQQKTRVVRTESSPATALPLGRPSCAPGARAALWLLSTRPITAQRLPAADVRD